MKTAFNPLRAVPGPLLTTGMPLAQSAAYAGATLGVQEPVAFSLGDLQSFSAALLAMASAARDSSPGCLLHDALQALRSVVPFRSAWWGECSDAQDSVPPRNWLHGRINLQSGFAQEWNDLAAKDVFASSSMRSCGTVVRLSGHGDPSSELTAFSRRHDLFHAMALTCELPGSGTLFFVSLYRSETASAFSDRDCALFAEFCAHLLRHWHTRVQDLLGARAALVANGFGLADGCGDLLYLGESLAAAIHRQYPDWSGSRLPRALAAAQRQVPCSVALGGRGLTLQPCGQLTVLSLDRGHRPAVLPPRERTVAMLYSRGHSYKEIARLLDLSPATVRTYLRNAYLQLGVRNKIELGNALGA
nr:LuxR C-terminal-related transcriptional regulator [uncultured Albidiferax sp.]